MFLSLARRGSVDPLRSAYCVVLVARQVCTLHHGVRHGSRCFFLRHGLPSNVFMVETTDGAFCMTFIMEMMFYLRRVRSVVLHAELVLESCNYHFVFHPRA